MVRLRELCGLCGSGLARVSAAILVVAVIGSVIGSAQQAGQAPAATFRSTTRLIVQTVSVKDKEGKPIEGLTAKDFAAED